MQHIRTGLGSALLFALSSCAICSKATFQCFDTPPGTADRKDTTIIVADRGWLSHAITSAVTEIVLREILGYTVTTAPSALGTSIWAADLANGVFDVEMESWQALETNPLYKEYVSPGGHESVLDLGGIGYAGRSGLYTLPRLVDSDKFAVYYKFFQNSTAASQAGVPTFAESQLKNVVGDAFPLCIVEDRPWCGTGALEGYWAAPLCREDPSSCVEIWMADPGWDTTYFEQLAKNNEVPAVFGYYGSHMTSYVRSVKDSGPVPVFYWYAPDPLLLEVNAKRISFPDHFTACERGDTKNANTGTVGCDYGLKLLKKVVSRRILDNAPEAYLFLTRMALYEHQINAIMHTTTQDGGGLTAMEAACQYVKSNLADVMLWVPSCVVNPPSVIVDGSEVFNPKTMTCEIATIFFEAQPTVCFTTNSTRPGTADRSDRTIRPGTADRSDRTIRLVRRNWLTHDLVSMITEVVLRDYLGFTVDLVLNNRTSASRWGPEMEAGLYDVDMEQWQVQTSSPLWQQYIATDQPVVAYLGGVGFPGRGGAYLPGATVAKHKMSDFYRFFDNGTQAGQAGFEMFVHSGLQQELGSAFPVCSSVEFSWCGTGAFEGCYAPPRCVENPDNCIEFIHASPAWETAFLETLVKNLNLDIVFGYYGDSYTETVLNKIHQGKSVIFYGWEPDAFVSKVQAKRLSFPDYSFGCDSGSTGNPDTDTVACDSKEKPLAKIASARSMQANPEARYTLERLELYLDQINSFLADHITGGGTKTSEDIVCGFIADHAETISSWAPDCLVNPIAVADMRVGDTLWSPSDLACKETVCMGNQVLQFVAQAREAFCTNCSAGEVPNADQTECKLCPEGQQPSMDGRVCEPCAAGSVKEAGQEFCLPCRQGHFQEAKGQALCEACPQGSYQSEAGGTACVSCDAVLLGASTRVLAATTSAECLCPEGAYRPMEVSICEPCPDGMTCPMGADMKNMPFGSSSRPQEGPYPLVKLGFMTRPAEPLTVYECGENKHCPGGPPGTCAHLRDDSAVACGECVGDAYETDSDCKECEGNDLIPIILTGLGVILAIVTFTIVINKNLLLQTNSTMMCTILLGMVFTGMQTMGVFRQLEVDWFEPMDTVFEVVTLLSFDFKVLKAACLIGSNGVTGYLLRQLVAPLLVPLVLVILLFRKRLDRSTKVWALLVNTVGSVFNVFFIAIMLSALLPLVCYDHPGDAGRSVASNPAILCDFTGDHLKLAFIGAGAFVLVPLPFVMIVFYGVYTYPRRIATGWSEDFLAMFRFLFFRFHPHAYWFGAIIVTRSTMTCLLPVVVKDTGVQVIVMAGMLCFFTILQQQVKPWRSDRANLADGVLNVLMVMLLLCAGLLSDLTTSADAIERVGSIVFVAILATIVTAFGAALYKKFFPGKKYFAFVCHHKADAGAQARYIKMLLTAKTNKNVFIDSDDLTELDKLFEVVKTQVANLVVYLTRDTLRRPWCAGEIATAWSCAGKAGSVKITAVRTGSFVPPGEEQLKNLETYLDMGSCNIREQGISLEDIQAAIRYLLSPEVTSIATDWGTVSTRKFAEIVSKFVGESPRDAARPPPLAPHDGALYISVEHGNDEACAASAILMAKLEDRVFGFMDGGIHNLLNYEETIARECEVIRMGRAVVFLLSGGTLQSERQVCHITSCMTQESMGSPMKTAVIPVNLKDFKFPTENFYATILPAMWDNAEEAQQGCKAFFKLISVPFSTNAQDSILDAQAKGVERRIPRTADRDLVVNLMSPVRSTSPSSGALVSPCLSERLKSFDDSSSVTLPLGQSGAVKSETLKASYAVGSARTASTATGNEASYAVGSVRTASTATGNEERISKKEENECVAGGQDTYTFTILL